MSKLEKIYKFAEKSFELYINYLEKKGVSTGYDLKRKRREFESMARRKDLTPEERAILERKLEILKDREEALEDYNDQLCAVKDRVETLRAEGEEQYLLNNRRTILEEYAINRFEDLGEIYDDSSRAHWEKVSKHIVNQVLKYLDEDDESINIELGEQYIDGQINIFFVKE